MFNCEVVGTWWCRRSRCIFPFARYYNERVGRWFCGLVLGSSVSFYLGHHNHQRPPLLDCCCCSFSSSSVDGYLMGFQVFWLIGAQAIRDGVGARRIRLLWRPSARGNVRTVVVASSSKWRQEKERNYSGLCVCCFCSSWCTSCCGQRTGILSRWRWGRRWTIHDVMTKGFSSFTSTEEVAVHRWALKELKEEFDG